MATARKMKCELGCERAYSTLHARRQHYRRVHQTEWENLKVSKRKTSSRSKKCSHHNIQQSLAFIKSVPEKPKIKPKKSLPQEKPNPTPKKNPAVLDDKPKMTYDQTLESLVNEIMQGSDPNLFTAAASRSSIDLSTPSTPQSQDSSMATVHRTEPIYLNSASRTNSVSSTLWSNYPSPISTPLLDDANLNLFSNHATTRSSVAASSSSWSNPSTPISTPQLQESTTFPSSACVWGQDNMSLEGNADLDFTRFYNHTMSISPLPTTPIQFMTYMSCGNGFPPSDNNTYVQQSFPTLMMGSTYVPIAFNEPEAFMF